MMLDLEEQLSVCLREPDGYAIACVGHAWFGGVVQNRVEVVRRVVRRLGPIDAAPERRRQRQGCDRFRPLDRFDHDQGTQGCQDEQNEHRNSNSPGHVDIP